MLLVVSWNVQSLVESTGDARICRKVPSAAKRVDRGLDFLSEELQKFEIGVAGIQETKWFGSDVWPVGACTFVHSGRPFPADGETARRNEGVEIWMGPDMTSAWRRGGEQWNAISSRIATARFLVGMKGDKLQRGGQRYSDQYLTIVNVYAPTSKATRAVKDKFFRDLQCALHHVNKNDVMVLLGAINARVGSLSLADPSDERPLWDQVLGQFGLGQCNQAGEDLLSFCARNSLCVMNTCFRKRPFRRGTWTHPATRQQHLIDYIILRQDQRVFCQDVTVMRGASFWTDHCMVRSKLALDFSRPRKSQSAPRRLAVHNLHDSDIRKEFQTKLDDVLGNGPGLQQESPGDDTIDSSWSRVRDPLISVSSSVLGYKRRAQPDWFLESRDELEPLIQEKNKHHQILLANDTRQNRQVFRRHQRLVAKAVRDAKDRWVMKTARHAEGAKKDGRTRWRCINMLQGVHVGRKSTATSSVLDENGNATPDIDSTRARFGRNFKHVLNVPSEFNADVVNSMPELEVREDLDTVPAFEELQHALGNMKRGTAAGQSGILPELVLCGGEVL
eukprot:scpid28797/ scgid9244/ Craniofacial development protein 2; p97 bucentaur protein